MNHVETQDLPRPLCKPRSETESGSLLSPVPRPGTRIETAIPETDPGRAPPCAQPGNGQRLVADGRKHKKLHYYNVKILMFAVGRSRQILHQLELLQDQTEGQAEGQTGDQTDNELR